MIQRAFGENDIVIYASSDDNYVPYLLVLIQSILKNSSDNHFYDFLVFEFSMSEVNKKIVEKQSEGYPNFKIRVIHIMDELNFDIEKLVTRTLTKEIWLKALGIYALVNYEKAIVIDCDVICCTDIAELYQYELGNNLIGAVKLLNSEIYRGNNFLNRRYIVLKEHGIDYEESYFNYGVVLQNLREFRNTYLMDEFIKMASEQQYLVQDQDLMNVLCKDRIAWIQAKWNVYPFLENEFQNTIQMIHEDERQYWIDGYKQPACIHYTTRVKPWLETRGVYSYSARKFWEYAVCVKDFDFNYFSKQVYTYDVKKRFVAEVAQKTYGELEYELCTKKLLVYGFGRRGQQILTSQKYYIEGFIDTDSSKHGIVNSIKIGGIELLDSDGRYVVLIANDEWENIALSLREKGVQSIYSYTCLEKKDCLLSWGVNVEDYYNVNKVFTLFQDERSRQVYDAIIYKRNHFPMDRTITYLDLQEGDQYFREDFFEYANDEVYVDIGAYTGDTINAFIKKRKGIFQKIYGFEMNSTNFRKLCKNIQDDRVELYNLALSDKEKEYGVIDIGYDSYLNDEIKINTIMSNSLDHIITDKITFIKINATNPVQILYGAHQLIGKYKPKLAIDVSHNYADLWEVPLVICKIMPEYKIYLRHHLSSCLNTVLYAV